MPRLKPILLLALLGATCQLVGASADSAETRDQVEQQNIETIRRQFQGFVDHDLDAIMETFAEDSTYESADGLMPKGTIYTGKAAIREVFRQGFESRPGLTFENLVTIVEHNQAVAYWTAVVPREGGEAVRVEGIDLFDLEEGKVTVKRNWLKSVAFIAGAGSVGTDR